MNDWFSHKADRKQPIDWLAADARLNSGVWGAWRSFVNGWIRVNDTVAKLKITGLRWATVELASEVFTLLVAGALVMLIAARPSMELVEKGDWLSYGKYAVTFYDRNGTEIGTRGILRSDAVPLEDMPDHFIKALLATEDRRFFEHYGVDVLGTARALVENLRAQEVVQGGSTLSQQLAKNVFLSSERSLDRKIKEAFLALWLETHISKQEILKLYLDRAYMGGGTFGAEAAAQHYFGKSIRNVTLPEAVMLAGLFKAPTNYSPNANLAKARERANEVLTNLVQAGYMTEGQVHGARINPATPIQQTKPDSPDWYLDWAFEEVQRIMAGKPDTVLEVRTTVDLVMQQAAETTVQTAIRDGGKVWNAKQAALVALEPDGAVRALVGGVDYAESGFNRATRSRRQPGSSFKPYVYLAALESGMTPNSIVEDKPYQCTQNHTVKNFDGGYRGRTTMMAALTSSINTVAVQLSQNVGRRAVSRMLERLGISEQRESCTMALGDGAMTLLEHTGGYAVFANGGKSAVPYGILEITNSRDEVVYQHERDAPPRRQVVQRKHIEMLNQMLNNVVVNGTAKAAILDFATSAGKTGTTSSHRDVWFVGITGQFAVGVWFGNDDNRPMQKVTGGHGPAPAWKEFMSAVYTTPDFPEIPGIPMNGAQAFALEQLRAQQAADPTFNRKPVNPNGLSDESRDLLTQIAGLMRKAGGPALAPPPAPPKPAPVNPDGELAADSVAPAADAPAPPAELPVAPE